MTDRSETLVKVPLFGTIAILVGGLTLMVATGPAVAAERGVAVSGSTQTPPADPRPAHAG